MAALIVEDGTGKEGADSYCSVRDASLFHSARGSGDAWDAVKDQSANLRKATDYITQTYRENWIGARGSVGQGLDWPRMNAPWPGRNSGFRPDNTIPNELKYATAELALRVESGDLLRDIGRETLSESVGEVSVTYQPGTNRQTRYASVDGWLAGLITFGGSGMIPISRA